jgi:glycosyltransferase involved in cell wall biosynthesis
MKIALVANTVWNIYNFRSGLIKELKKTGYSIHAIAPRDEYTDRLKKMGIQYHYIKMDSKSVNPLIDLLLFYRLIKLYKKIRPDIFLHFTIKPNIYGTLIAGFLKIPAVNNITGLGNVFLKRNFINFLVRFLYKISLSYASVVFFQNKADMELFTTNLIVSKKKTGLLPGSGVNIKDFIPLDKTRNDNKTVFLLIARMIWEKGIKEFVEAAGYIKKQYKNTVFQLAGKLGVNNPSAIPAKRIKEWQAKGIITYLGHVDDIQEIIKDADCIVLPSYYREGVPRVLLEAASMEKPIITTDNIGCREVVIDGINGYICKIKDSKDLAFKMVSYLKLPEKEKRIMGENGRKLVKSKFNENIVIKRYKNAILKVAGKH